MVKAKIVNRMTQTMIHQKPENIMVTEVLCLCKGDKPVLVPVEECLDCDCHNGLIGGNLAVECGGDVTVKEEPPKEDGSNE